MVPAPHLIARFIRDLDALAQPGKRLGVAVSGGPDSLALLLLAAAARPGLVEAATVDHALRPQARDEADMVSRLSEKLGVPHRVLTVEWSETPKTAIQERARSERYLLLSEWARDRELDTLATAHHADDQAETFLMRLSRGAGVRGLAAMRKVAHVPGSEITLIRPLLGWRRKELEQICSDASIEPVNDPSNADEQFERVRIRREMATTPCLDAASIASSALLLGEADDALKWATQLEWERSTTSVAGNIKYLPTDAPAEVRRRILARIVASLGTEGDALNLRGREMDRLVDALSAGKQATLRGVHCEGGEEWRFTKAPPRRR